MNVEYSIKAGSRIKGDPAEIGAALEQVRRDKGGLSARPVWEAARPVHHPLHSYFTWSNKKAAGLHRDNEARHLIASVLVTVTEGAPSAPVRAYVAIGGPEDRYQPTLEVLSQADTRQQLLTSAADELAWFQSKYEALDELSEICAAIGTFLKRRKVA